MHRKFAAWLAENPWRAASVSVFCWVLSSFGVFPFAIVAGAMPTLVLLHKGRAAGRTTVNAASLVVFVLVWILSQSFAWALGTAIGVFWVTWALGLLLARFGSLTLCFQVAALAAASIIAAIYAGLHDATAQWRTLIEQLVKPLQDAGLQFDQKSMQAFAQLTNWGTPVAMLMLLALSGLFLARWWQSLLDAPGNFGAEYRQLRLGKVLGALASLVVLGGLLLSKLNITVAVVDAWLWIAVVALALQGLGAIHGLKAANTIGRGWLTAVYILLIVPPTAGLMVILLAGWGLADNWLGARFRPR